MIQVIPTHRWRPFAVTEIFTVEGSAEFSLPSLNELLVEFGADFPLVERTGSNKIEMHMASPNGPFGLLSLSVRRYVVFEGRCKSDGRLFEAPEVVRSSVVHQLVELIMF